MNLAQKLNEALFNIQKVLVLGPSKGGKSTVGEMVASILGTKSVDTSTLLIDEFSKEKGITPEEIMRNKDIYRKELFEFGLSKQQSDPAYFTRKALKQGNVVVGVRPRIEYDAVCDWFDLILWVGGRVAPGLTDQLTPADADIIIDNTGSLEDTKRQVIKAIEG